MRVLQVVEQAFRTLAEEQDDTILWLTRSMNGAGADLSVLLVGHAANYAVDARRQPALVLGDWIQREPADPARDVVALIGSKVPVYVLGEDLVVRGLGDRPLLPGVQRIGREQLPELYELADQVWQW